MNTLDMEKFERYESYIERRGAKRQGGDKETCKIDTNRLDKDTVDHLVRLGYSTDEIKEKVDSEDEIIGKLYRRLLTLKIN